MERIRQSSGIAFFAGVILLFVGLAFYETAVGSVILAVGIIALFYAAVVAVMEAETR